MPIRSFDYDSSKIAFIFSFFDCNLLHHHPNTYIYNSVNSVFTNFRCSRKLRSADERDGERKSGKGRYRDQRHLTIAMRFYCKEAAGFGVRCYQQRSLATSYAMLPPNQGSLQILENTGNHKFMKIYFVQKHLQLSNDFI